MINLPPGPHRLKFIVDESWRCSDDLATATDADGSLVNYIEVSLIHPSTHSAARVEGAIELTPSRFLSRRAG